MYASYFGLTEPPFSITPDPRYLYMSQHHREALAHLLYGIGEGGGFVQLTGEVGTGKTTLCRCLLEQIPAHVDVALILNPRLTALELLKSICDELRIAYPEDTTSLKQLVDILNAYLLQTHAAGRRTVTIIDEAQNLSPDVLEQIRLLTNLETTTEKLLQIILIGQPELISLLERRELRQLAQRITARYHLPSLSEDETTAYIDHRMEVAGRKGTLFTRAAARQVYQITEGIPRLINVICDRALLGAYARDKYVVDAATVRHAAKEVLGRIPRRYGKPLAWAASVAVIIGLSVAGSTVGWDWRRVLLADITEATPVQRAALPATPASPVPAKAPARLVPDRAAAKPYPRDGAEVTKTRTTNASGDAARDPQTLTRLLSDPNFSTDIERVLAHLFARWKQDYHVLPGMTLCERAQSAGLECLHKSGTWESLRAYNLPAVIEISTTEDKTHRALVEELQGDQVTLDFGTDRRTWPVTEVASLWHGDYLLLWRPPPFKNRRIRPGIQGPVVLWLRQQITQLEGQALPAVDESVYDEMLENRIMAFQQRRSLIPDGIVGEQTLIHLSTALKDRAVPLLSEPSPSAAPQQSSR